MSIWFTVESIDVPERDNYTGDVIEPRSGSIDVAVTSFHDCVRLTVEDADGDVALLLLDTDEAQRLAIALINAVRG